MKPIIPEELKARAIKQGVDPKVFKRKEEVLRYKFGLDGYKQLTYAQIAKKFGKSLAWAKTIVRNYRYYVGK